MVGCTKPPVKYVALHMSGCYRLTKVAGQQELQLWVIIECEREEEVKCSGPMLD